jgi:tetratricopeptide (TPR) repeat protein
MHDKYGDKGVVLVALSYESDSLVKKYVKDNNLPYIVGAGAKATEKAYNVKAYPTMFLIDPEGNIAWIGHFPDEEMTKTLDTLLKENPPKSKAKFGDKASQDALKKADSLLEKKKYAEALKAYEKVAKDFKGSKAAKKAKAAIEEMKSDEKIMAKIQAAEQKKECEEWLDMARSLAKTGDKAGAVEYYNRIIEKYPDSRYAKTAQEEKAQLET